MTSLRYQYDALLKKSERCKRPRSDRKRALQQQINDIVFRSLKDYVRKTSKQKRAA